MAETEPNPAPQSNGGAPPEPAATPQTDHAAEAAAARAELTELKGKLGNLTDYLARADGDTIANAVSKYLQIKADPKLGQIVARYEQDGSVSASDTSGDDEYITPEQKEIRELRAELRGIKSGQDELTLATGQQALEGHIKRFVGDYPLEPGELQTVREHLQKTFKSWMGQGETGRRALQNIQSPDNYKMVKNLLVSALVESSEDTIFQLGDRRERRKRGRLEDFRTDEPSNTAGRNEPMPEFKRANSALSALDAWNYAEAHPERIRDSDRH